MRKKWWVRTIIITLLILFFAVVFGVWFFGEYFLPTPPDWNIKKEEMSNLFKYTGKYTMKRMDYIGGLDLKPEFTLLHHLICLPS